MARSIAISLMLQRLPHARDLDLPRYARAGDSGMDVRAARSVWIFPFTSRVVPLGIAVALPPGLEIQVRPRSGMTRKSWLQNIGTIDSGYRGELGAVLYNARPWPRLIRRGDRCAQIVVAPIQHVAWDELPVEDVLPTSLRGNAGWGSSGHR